MCLVEKFCGFIHVAGIFVFFKPTSVSSGGSTEGLVYGTTCFHIIDLGFSRRISFFKKKNIIFLRRKTWLFPCHGRRILRAIIDNLIDNRAMKNLRGIWNPERNLISPRWKVGVPSQNLTSYDGEREARASSALNHSSLKLYCFKTIFKTSVPRVVTREESFLFINLKSNLKSGINN